MTAWFDHGFPTAAKIADGRWIVGDVLHGGPDWGVYRASGEGRVLVTMALRRGSSRDRLGPRLAFPIEGVTPLHAVATIVDAGGVPYDALVEAEPAGAPLTAQQVAAPWAVACGIAAIVARAHASGYVLDGIRPELVYASGDHCAGIAPRGPTFHFAATEPWEGTAQCFEEVYMSPEAIEATPTTMTSDVFSLCATLIYLFSGMPPFDGQTLMERLTNAFRGVTRAVAIDPVLLAGLDRDPVARPNSQHIFEAIRRTGMRFQGARHG